MKKFYIEPRNSELKHQKMAKLGGELGIPIPQAFLEMEVFNSKGESIQHFKYRSHSWTRTGYNIFFANIAGKLSAGAYGAGTLALKDTGGVTRVNATNLVGMSQGQAEALNDAETGYRGIANAVIKGILVGTGTNAESFEDYVLQTPIANGSGAGQLSVVAQELPVLSYDAGTKTLTCTHVRYFNNNSGGDITVNECVFVCCAQGSASQQKFCVSRDKLLVSPTIPDSGQLKVTYTISLVYPA
jgi:hypothetical protein